MEKIFLDKNLSKFTNPKVALEWFSLLLRDPTKFRYKINSLSFTKKAKLVSLLFIHSMPYILLITIVVFLIVFNIFEISDVKDGISAYDLITQNIFSFEFVKSILIGGMLGILLGLAVKSSISKSIIISYTLFILIYIALKGINLLNIPLAFAGAISCSYMGIIFGTLSGGNFKGVMIVVILGFFFGGLFIFSANIVELNIFHMVSAGLIMLTSMRLHYFPVHLFLIWPKIRAELYFHHPIAWDDSCPIPFPGLEHLLVAFSGKDSFSAHKEIEMILTNYPSQKKAALKAKTILIAREAAKAENLVAINDIIAQLPEGDKGFLRSTSEIRRMANEIVQLQITLDAASRPMLKEPNARALKSEIENFLLNINNFNEPLKTEFKNAAIIWQRIATNQLERARTILNKEPSPQVFRAGEEIDRNKDAFVKRYEILDSLYKEIESSTGSSGIVIYGRRKVGKSTFLKNLEGFLSEKIVPITISMEHPDAGKSISSFSKHIASHLNSKFQQKIILDDFSIDLSGLYSFLSEYDNFLKKNNLRLILALDEYENIDRKIIERIFPEELLTTIRESVKNHRNITWIFSGCHEINQLQYPKWSSHLISFRTITIPLFSIQETRLLLTMPLQFADARSYSEQSRPKLGPNFWGNNGIERIFYETGGWPFLVQLLATAIVDLIDEEGKFFVDDKLFDKALEKSISRSLNFMEEIVKRESTLPGELEYLENFRDNLSQKFPEDDKIADSLRRRLLVIEDGDNFKLRIPLIAKWLQNKA